MVISLLFAAAITIPATGHYVLPAGTVVLTAPIALPKGAHDLVISGNPKGTILRAAAAFRGKALITIEDADRIRLSGFSIQGNRRMVSRSRDLPPSNVAFRDFYEASGIVADNSRLVTVRDIAFREIAGFAILASRCKEVDIDRIHVTDSGSRNGHNRNNTTGGVLLEEGTSQFHVIRSVFRNVLGNGVWTHSNYGSKRNGPGEIVNNQFFDIGRDAVQVGHASHVVVESNTGSRIGFPIDAVDIEGGATPVGIDTSGDVDHTVYRRNRFTEVNGKCIDLDGFHDGQVSENTCVNQGRAEDYPHGHFGIVVNNWNPDMESTGIVIRDNTIDGSKFGGIFLIGTGHTVVNNRLLRLNLAGCNESAAKFGCVAIQGEPGVLEAGIYLGRIAAEWAQKRAAPSSHHLIRDNVITGFKMRERCILAAPGVDLKASTIENNTCKDTNER